MADIVTNLKYLLILKLLQMKWLIRLLVKQVVFEPTSYIHNKAIIKANFLNQDIIRSKIVLLKMSEKHMSFTGL